MRAEDEVRAEVHALWTTVFGEPPIVEAPIRTLLDVLVVCLPGSGYETIRRLGVTSPYDQSVNGVSSGPSE